MRLLDELGEGPRRRRRETRAGALRARPARRGRGVGGPRGRARRERRRDHPDALAAGQSEGARAARRARRGGAARPRGDRDRRGDRHAQPRETRTPTSARCSRWRAARDEAAAAFAEALRALRAQGEPRHGRADAEAARGDRGIAALACRAASPDRGARLAIRFRGRMARFGVRSGSLPFAACDGNPANRRLSERARTGGNGPPAFAMQKVVGSSPIIRFAARPRKTAWICRLERQLGKPHGHVEVWIVASADDAR